MDKGSKKIIPAWFSNIYRTIENLKLFLESDYDGYKHVYRPYDWFKWSHERHQDILLNSRQKGSNQYEILHKRIPTNNPYIGRVNSNYSAGAYLNTFSLAHPIYKETSPEKPWFPEDDVDVIVKAKLVDIQRYEKAAGRYWNRSSLERWLENKNIAKEFKANAEEKLLKFKSLYVDERALHVKAKTSISSRTEQILKINPLPSFFEPNYQIFYDQESRVLQITFDFPDYKEKNIPVGTNVKGDKIKYASDAAKKKLVKETLYGLIVWIGHVVASQISAEVKQIAINTRQSWFDPATGSPTEGTIASVLADREYLANLNIEKLDPIACFKQMKGLVTPSLEKQTSIRPIFEMNKDDSRLVDSIDIDGSLEEGSNLAAMPWEDFEHLVAQLFEWQFAKDGTEVKVTQASRDRGVDAIVFDPDPFMGGKYVLQAKRYTNTVDVASVRDLYGTVMNEGANRGILITTSSYGPDAYDFAKDKPISLVDGPNLLNLLREHGKKYRIDLEEAKLLNKEE